MKKIVIILALVFLFSISAYAKIHWVPSPHIATIQGGINLAEDGDTVLVLPDVYYENINFKGKNILVASNFIFDQDTNTIHNTIIDGSDTATVVTFNSNEDSTASIKGFTIRHGCSGMGGGIYCENSSPRIAYNVIKENVTDPSCSDFNIGGSFLGGGICCIDCSAIIEHNRIVKNICVPEAEGWALGGGIGYLGKKAPIIRYNLIALNRVKNSDNFQGIGGGIFGGDTCIAIIHNNTIVNNYTEGGEGGGIFNCPMLPGTKIFNNIVAYNSNGINFWNIPGYTYEPLLAYNNFWGNVNGNFFDFSPEVGDTTWGFNLKGTPCDSFYNIVRDPLFVDRTNFNFHLSATSPCIDAGDPDSPLDPDSTIADMGAFYYHQNQTFVKEDDLHIPVEYKLLANYPNPFNSSTTIWLEVLGSELGEPVHTTLKIYNIQGQLVRTLVDEEKAPGNYNIIWDSRDNSSREVSSGIYFYQLKTKDYTDTRKMVLLR